MAYYLIILFIAVTSYGVVRQAVQYQNESVSWTRTLRNVWFYPYWMIYGELFAEEIDRKCWTLGLALSQNEARLLCVCFLCPECGCDCPWHVEVFEQVRSRRQVFLPPKCECDHP